MTAILDKYGRILLPKKLRQALGLTENIKLSLRREGNQIIIEPLKEETLFQEKDGFLVFTGQLPDEEKDWVAEDREARDRYLLGL